jgi:hypothetical protein
MRYMRYCFEIVRDTNDEILLRESRNWDAIVTGGIILVILIVAIVINISARQGILAVRVLGLGAVCVVGLLARGITRTEISVQPQSVRIMRSIGSFRLDRKYSNQELDRFREITAPLLGGGGKGLLLLTSSGRAVKVTLWSRSTSLAKETNRLNDFMAANRKLPAKGSRRHLAPDG